MKNLNIEELGLYSLNQDEATSTNGGWKIENPDCIICYAINFAYAVAEIADSFWTGLTNGFNAGVRAAQNN